MDIAARSTPVDLPLLYLPPATPVTPDPEPPNNLIEILALQRGLPKNPLDIGRGLYEPPPSKAENKIELRDYQKRMVGDVYAAIREGYCRILAIAVMGAGKTVVSSWIMRDVASKGRKTVFLVMYNVLLGQTQRTLKALGVRCTIMQGGRVVDRSAPVVIASLQTISSRLRRGQPIDKILGNPDLCIVDEAHVAAFQAAYIQIEQHYAIRGCKFLGLTATPWRLSRKEWLGQRFDRVVVGPQPPEIIKLGGALPCRGFTLTEAIDLDSLHTRNGDYIDTEIASQATRDEALAYIFAEWKRLAGDRPTLMIGATVRQAQATNAYFNKHGVVSELIVGSTPAIERQSVFERVKRGKTQLICSVGALTAGFDLPQISAILYVRATKSKSLFQQSAGRGSRPHKESGKQNYLLLDFGGNLKRFGNPMGFQDYSIDEPKPSKSEASTKDCPECGYECWTFELVCPECGYEFPPGKTDSSAGEEGDDFSGGRELNEFFDDATKKQVAQLRAWKRVAFRDRLNPAAPHENFKRFYGFYPPNEWHIHACLGKRCSKARRDEFAGWLKGYQGTADQRWLQHYLNLEFGNGATLMPAEWHEVLGIPPDAPWDEIKAAYRQRARDYHPDVSQESDALAKMQEVNAAFLEAKRIRSP